MTTSCSLPSSLKWSSSAVLVNPVSDSNHSPASVKDPSIQKYNGKYIIYCTVYNQNASGGSSKGYGIQFLQFTDFAQAASAKPVYMDTTASGFAGYRCAPELVYFAPQKLWYLVYQQQDPAYSTTTTPDDPKSWTRPKPFFSGTMPKPSGWSGSNWLPIDYWPICDDKNAYIFFTGDDGKVYRTKTSIDKFPNGFSTPVIVKSAQTSIIFEGGSHYKIKGTANTYLHMMEAMGSQGRYYNAWTSEGIEGEWKDYMVGENKPFAHPKKNVTWPGSAWSTDVSHGELLRDSPDMTQEVDMCSLKFLFQGLDPSKANVSYDLKPYKLGLLTATY